MKKLVCHNLVSIFFVFVGWFFCILPSVYKAGWFYLDTPTILVVAKSIFSGISWLLPDPTSGRYFPIYWLYYGIIYNILGSTPFNFYLAQSILVLLTSIMIFWLTKQLTKSNYWAIFACILFFIGSPVAETIYSLGKPEPLLLFLVLLSFVLLWKFENSNHRIKKIAFALGIIFLTSFSVWTKETAMVLSVFGFVGLVLAFYFFRDRENKHFITFLVYLGTTLLGIIIGRVPFIIFKYSFQIKGSYTSYPITFDLIKRNLLFYLEQQPDVLFLGLIVLGLVLMQFFSIKKSLHTQQFNFIFCCAMLATSWGYIFGLLIWRWPMGYYLYVSSALFSILLPVLLFKCQKLLKKAIIYGVLLCIILLKAYSLLYNYYVATGQKAAELLYSDVIQSYIMVAEREERLVVEQWPFFSEQVYQSNLLLNNVLRKNDLKMEGIWDILEPSILTDDIKKLYQVNNIPDPKDRLPRKGDLVLVWIGYKPAYWSIRGVAPYSNDRSRLQELGYKLDLVKDEKIQNKVILFEKKPWRLKIDNTYLGYRLYRVTKDY